MTILALLLAFAGFAFLALLWAAVVLSVFVLARGGFNLVRGAA